MTKEELKIEFEALSKRKDELSILTLELAKKLNPNIEADRIQLSNNGKYSIEIISNEELLKNIENLISYSNDELEQKRRKLIILTEKITKIKEEISELTEWYQNVEQRIECEV